MQGETFHALGRLAAHNAEVAIPAGLQDLSMTK